MEVHDFHEMPIGPHGPGARRLREIKRLASAADNYPKWLVEDFTLVPFQRFEPRLQIHREGLPLGESFARSSSVRRTSRFSVSIALVVWFKMLSADRTFTAAGVLGSTITFPNVETAAADIWWSRPIACEYTAHFAARKAAWNSGTCNQRSSVFGAMPTARAASSVFRVHEQGGDRLFLLSPEFCSVAGHLRTSAYQPASSLHIRQGSISFRICLLSPPTRATHVIAETPPTKEKTYDFDRRST
jgi:hypothetical protein